MKVALVTMKVQPGKCADNFQSMLKYITKAKEDGADLIVFPQNVISGYLLGDEWLEDAWCTYVDHFNDLILSQADDIAIVWGNLRYRNRRRFNAGFFAYQGKTHMRVKRNEMLPYMNDAVYFENNEINSAIEYKDMVFALNFGMEVQLADMNINLDAYPYDMEKERTTIGNVVYVNSCGMQNNDKNVMIMEGGSFVQRNHNLIYHAPYFEEDYALVDLHQEKSVEKPKRKLLDALTLGIQEFDAQVFQGKLPWVVGLSGGLDSSVTCALLAHSLGPDRIYGYNLATRHNRDITKQNAREEAQALQIHYQEGSIEEFVKAVDHMYTQEFSLSMSEYPVLVKENMQARARGYLLSGFAGMLGGIVVNNANKVEAMLGYCTLYGDSVGAISLIGDLTKVQLFTLSKEINEQFGRTIIPDSLLPVISETDIVWEMAPSAELKDAQLDPMKWFYHDYLVDHLGRDLDVLTFMKQYNEHTLPEELQRWITYYGLHDPQVFLEDLKWFLSTRNRNAFKRLQMAPLLSVHHATLSNQSLSQMTYDMEMYETMRKEIRKDKSF